LYYPPDNAADITSGEQIASSATSITVKAGDTRRLCGIQLDFAPWIISAQARDGAKQSIYMNKRVMRDLTWACPWAQWAGVGLPKSAIEMQSCPGWTNSTNREN
jgi:hypothetical protein